MSNLGKKHCLICRKLIDPQGLAPHMAMHLRNNETEEDFPTAPTKKKTPKSKLKINAVGSIKIFPEGKVATIRKENFEVDVYNIDILKELLYKK